MLEKRVSTEWIREAASIFKSEPEEVQHLVDLYTSYGDAPSVMEYPLESIAIKLQEVYVTAMSAAARECDTYVGGEIWGERLRQYANRPRSNA